MEVSSKPEIYLTRQTYIFDDMLSQLDAKNSFSNIEGWKPVDKEGIIKRIQISSFLQKVYLNQITIK